MVRVSQASCRPDSEPPKHKHDRRQEQGQHLAPGVQFECPIWVPPRVVSDDYGGGWDDAQENDGCNNAVRNN